MSQDDMPELPPAFTYGQDMGMPGKFALFPAEYMHAYARQYAAQQVAKEFYACHKAALAMRDAAIEGEREACARACVKGDADDCAAAVRARKEPA